MKTYPAACSFYSSKSCVLRTLWAAIACLCLLLAGGLSAWAGTIHLSAAGPSTSLLNVLTNEPITFIADDEGPYAVVSYNWAAGTLYLPHAGSTATVILAFSGLYNYEDGRGHYGMIWVNIPPTCKITNPTNNAVFTAPASFDFNVDARDTDGDKMMGVDFWLDTTYLYGTIYLPYTVRVSNLGPGTYTLKATAVDYGEGTATDSITIHVQAPTILLSNPRRAGAQLVFDVSGLSVGKSVVLESRSGLNGSESWIPLHTNVAAATSISLTNPISAGAAFFRAYQLP